MVVPRDLAGMPVDQVRGRSRKAAEEALARVNASADRFLLIFDVDVVDFLDLPMAGIPQHKAGLTFDEAMTYLAVLPDATGWPG